MLIQIILQGLALTILIFTTTGGSGNAFLLMGEGEKDETAFGYLVGFGYFYIISVQLIGIIMGEPISFQVMFL